MVRRYLSVPGKAETLCGRRALAAGSVTNLPCATGMVGDESYWAAAQWDFQLRWISFVIWLFLVTGLCGGYAAAMFVFLII